MLSISGGKPVLFRNKPEKEYITFTNIAGVGEEHAKWSPVATAWYRLMPEVVLLRPVTGDEAAELASTHTSLGLGDFKLFCSLSVWRSIDRYDTCFER